MDIQNIGARLAWIVEALEFGNVREARVALEDLEDDLASEVDDG